MHALKLIECDILHRLSRADAVRICPVHDVLPIHATVRTAYTSTCKHTQTAPLHISSPSLPTMECLIRGAAVWAALQVGC